MYVPWVTEMLDLFLVVSLGWVAAVYWAYLDKEDDLNFR